MQPLLISAIVVFGSITGPLLLSYLNNKQRKSERIEDYARQDLVAAKVTQAATQAAEAAELLRVSNDRIAVQVAETTSITNIKLDQIHTLVNSNMTSALQSELDATNAQLALMLEVGTLKEAAGLKQTERAKIAEQVITAKIAELSAVINDRLTTN